MFTDTASISSLLSVVAARHALPGLEATERGLTGARLRLYGSAEMHSSIDKAAIVAGTGRAGIRRIPVDEALRIVAERGLVRSAEQQPPQGLNQVVQDSSSGRTAAPR